MALALMKAVGTIGLTGSIGADLALVISRRMRRTLENLRALTH